MDKKESGCARWLYCELWAHMHNTSAQMEHVSNVHARQQQQQRKKRWIILFFVCDAEIVLFVVIFFFVRKQVFIGRRRSCGWSSNVSLQKWAQKICRSLALKLVPRNVRTGIWVRIESNWMVKKNRLNLRSALDLFTFYDALFPVLHNVKYFECIHCCVLQCSFVCGMEKKRCLTK